MIPASAEYIAYENQLIGATPEVRATVLPYIWPTPISADGTFKNCTFVAPGRLQVYDGPFADVLWVSSVLTSYLQVSLSPAIVSWDETASPFYALAVYYWGASNPSDLSSGGAAWILLAPENTVHIRPFYQFMITMKSYRFWAVDSEGDADDFTAWAEDTPDDYQGYAADEISPAYIENLQLLGEYTIVRDIEAAGSVSMEAPTDFNDLVAGNHSGLLLNNRQGSFDGNLLWTPAPRYSPNKSSFFLSGQNWYGLRLRIDLGWKRSGWNGAPVKEIAAITADGDFVNCAYVSPGRVQANYEGFANGSSTSPVLISNLQGYTLPVLISWKWNSPGFDSLLYYRGADDLVTLAGAAWELVAQGDLIQVAPYCQLKLTLEGYRSWAVDAGAASYKIYTNETDFKSALNSGYYCENFEGLPDDIPLPPTVSFGPVNGFSYDAYAEHGLYRGPDPLNYNLSTNYNSDPILITFTGSPVYAFGGQFFTVCAEGHDANGITTIYVTIGGDTIPVVYDSAYPRPFLGIISSEPLTSVSIASEQLGPYATQWPCVDNFYVGICDFTAYAVDSDSDDFLSYAGGDVPGDPLTYIEDLKFLGQITDLITLFLGKITRWGPFSRSVDQDGALQPHTVEVYATDWIMDCLQKRIALPAEDGAPAPLTFGEFLCEADEIVGRSPAPPDLAVDFEDGELGSIVEIGGGSCSLISPGLTGTKAFRATVTGPNQSAYRTITLPVTGEIFVTGTMRFVVSPAMPANINMAFLQIISNTGSCLYSITVDNTGAIYSFFVEQSDFLIQAYKDVVLPFALWFSPASAGNARLWINGDEILKYQGNLSGTNPIEIRVGPITGATAENWTIDFDDIQIRGKYYDNAFQVTGGPFDSIGPVYIDNVNQPASKTVIREGVSYLQVLWRYPAYGMVQILSTDPEYRTSGTVMLRVIEHAGGRHALTIIESLFAAADLTDYIDADALAAAYAACPDDIIHARFVGGSMHKQGLKDIASLGTIVRDAIIEITARCLYWVFVDNGKIKIIPYTGAPPSDPVMALIASNMRGYDQNYDFEQINDFVTAIYGWYDRNRSLHYVAGTQVAGGQGIGLDFSWTSPVVCEDPSVVKAKADLLLKFLSGKELIDNVSMSLAGARMELMDSVSMEEVLLNDEATNYRVFRKEVSLDAKSHTTSLLLGRVLGEN
jgi:hypothetical protein